MLATEGGLQSGPMFTPYGSKLTIVFPSTIGIVNWHGMSYNPKLGYLFVNTNEIAGIGKLVAAAPGAEPAFEKTSPWDMPGVLGMGRSTGLASSHRGVSFGRSM